MPKDKTNFDPSYSTHKDNAKSPQYDRTSSKKLEADPKYSTSNYRRSDLDKGTSDWKKAGSPSSKKNGEIGDAPLREAQARRHIESVDAEYRGKNATMSKFARGLK